MPNKFLFGQLFYEKRLGRKMDKKEWNQLDINGENNGSTNVIVFQTPEQ